MHLLPIPVLSDPNDARAAQVFVDVVADGIPVRMLLDSGTHRTWIPHRESIRVVGTEDGKPLVRLEMLRWGSLEVPDLVVAMNEPGWPHPPLLGMDILGSHACHFRFTSGVLELDGEPPGDDLFPLATEPHKTPTVPLRWPGRATHALWDTGAGIGIVNRSWAEANPEIVTITKEFGTGTDASGRTGRNPKGRFAPCRIGRAEFPEQKCGIARLDGALTNMSLTVGMPLISQADWYMDFPRRRWFAQPSYTDGPANA